jgi:hypothetical protein
MMESNITMHIEKAHIPAINQNIKIIEPFEGIQKNNSRIIFFILLMLIMCIMIYPYLY